MRSTAFEAAEEEGGSATTEAGEEIVIVIVIALCLQYVLKSEGVARVAQLLLRLVRRL